MGTASLQHRAQRFIIHQRRKMSTQDAPPGLASDEGTTSAVRGNASNMSSGANKESSPTYSGFVQAVLGQENADDGWNATVVVEVDLKACTADKAFKEWIDKVWLGGGGLPKPKILQEG